MKINRSGKSKVLTEKEYARIRKQFAYNWQKVFFDILWYTGERAGAVTKLKWEYVYQEPNKPRNTIVFKSSIRKPSVNGKGKTLSIPVHENLFATLSTYQVPWAKTIWMFPGRNLDNHIWRQTVDAALRTACDRAGFSDKGISTHSFRRTLITRLSDKGVSVRTIQQVTGHASLNSVQTYIECDERKIKEAIDLL